MKSNSKFKFGFDFIKENLKNGKTYDAKEVFEVRDIDQQKIDQLFKYWSSLMNVLWNLKKNQLNLIFLILNFF